MNFPVLPSNDDRLIVYYKSGCPYSDATRKRLREYRCRKSNNCLKYVLYDVDEIAPSKDVFWSQIKPYLKNMYNKEWYNNPNHRTFPVIFLQGKLLGDNDTLQKILNNL